MQIFQQQLFAETCAQTFCVYRDGLAYTNYETRLNLFKLQTLENRRLLTTLHRRVHNKFDFDISQILQFNHRESRRHQFQIKIKQKNRKSVNSFSRNVG